MNAPPLSTLAARFVEKLHPARRILHAFPSFYMRRLFAAPVLPKLCGGMVFLSPAVRYNKSVPE